jgi:hypothetical protein
MPNTKPAGPAWSAASRRADDTRFIRNSSLNL